MCVKLNKNLKLSLGYKYNLAIKLNDYFFITKSMLTKPKYKVSLYYFDCKIGNDEYCYGQYTIQNTIDSNEYIFIEDLTDGLYGIEVSLMDVLEKSLSVIPPFF
jgi:hypothetical protein